MLQTILEFLIPIVVGTLSFVATEYCFKIKEEDKIAKSQKHFWSIVFAIFGIVFSMSLSSSMDVSRKLASLNNADLPGKLQGLQNDLDGLVASDTTLTKIVSDYNHEFGLSTTACMRKWRTEAFNKFDSDIQSGWIDLGGQEAPRVLASEYDEARSEVVATNVGSTKFYFDHKIYREANKKLAKPDRHIPVVRFFFYGGKIASDAKDFSAYIGQVKLLTKSMNTLCSVVIDTDRVSVPNLGDYLLVDRKFVAKTLPTDEATWRLESAQASEDLSNIKGVSNYLSSLYDLCQDGDGIEFVCLQDVDVQQDFAASPFYPATSSINLARTMYSNIMESVRAAGEMNRSMLTASAE